MQQCIIYTRFSPRPDADTSESCDTQERQCRDYAERKGWTVSRVFSDPDRSGSDEFREILWQAIDAIRKGGILLVAKRDRLARNVYLSEQISRSVSKKGGRIVAVFGDVDGDGPEQTLVRQVTAAMAEYERKSIAARTRASMRSMQKAGKRMSKLPPYGWRTDPGDPSRIVRDEREQAILADIAERIGKGESLRAIMAALPPEAARCGRWHYEVLRRIVVRMRRDGEI